MDDGQIVEMLKEIVVDIDYDIYKEMFVHEELDHSFLVSIVKKYLGAE